MLNHELLKTEIGFNKFTRKIKELCAKDYLTIVRMRNGNWIEVIYQSDMGEDDNNVFRTKNYSHIWELNGKSITSSDFDLIEIRNPPKVK
jgi:hypothetical protein